MTNAIFAIWTPYWDPKDVTDSRLLDIVHQSALQHPTMDPYPDYSSIPHVFRNRTAPHCAIGGRNATLKPTMLGGPHWADWDRAAL
jgi:hypothetical protein